jgi:hypothetical protein
MWFLGSWAGQFLMAMMSTARWDGTKSGLLITLLSSEYLYKTNRRDSTM